MKRVTAGYACKIKLRDGQAIVLLRKGEEKPLIGYEFTTDGDVAALRLDNSGNLVNSFISDGNEISH